MNRLFRDKAASTSTVYCASRFRVYWNVIMALSPRKRRRPIRESWCVGWAVSLREQTHLSALVANDEKSYFSGGGKRQPRRYGCIHRLLGSLRSNDATATRTSLKKWICVLCHLNRVFGPAQYVKMQATFPEVEFLRILFRFKKRKENSSSYVHVLHKTSN